MSYWYHPFSKQLGGWLGTVVGRDLSLIQFLMGFYHYELPSLKPTACTLSTGVGSDEFPFGFRPAGATFVLGSASEGFLEI